MIENENELAPRDRLKAILDQAKIDNAKAKGELTEEEQFDQDVASAAEEIGDDPEEDDESQPVDKHMGKQKIEVTREQHQGNQLQDSAIKALQTLKTGNQEHLTPEEMSVVRLALSMLETGKLKDPVLIHLLMEKVELSKQYIQSTVAIRELQSKMLQEISMATNTVVKCKGAIENQDRQILKLVKANPGLLD